MSKKSKKNTSQGIVTIEFNDNWVKVEFTWSNITSKEMVQWLWTAIWAIIGKPEWISAWTRAVMMEHIIKIWVESSLEEMDTSDKQIFVEKLLSEIISIGEAMQGYIK